MENASLSSNVWNNVTTTSTSTLEDDFLRAYLANIRYIAFKIIYIIIGTIGMIDNLFVIVIFALFIKISDKVYTA